MDWRVFREMGACEQEWRAFERTALLTPFQRFDWLNAWFRAVGALERASLRIVFGYEGGRPAIVFPLAVENTFAGRRLVWMGWRWSNYNAPLVAPWAAERLSTLAKGELTRVLADLVPEAHFAFLAKQPATIAGLPNPLVTRAAPDANPAFMVRIEDTADRSAKTSRRFREKEKRLQRSGTLEYRCERDPAARAELIRTLLAWKVEQLEHRGSRTILTEPSAADILVGAADSDGAGVELHALCLDGVPLAIVYIIATPTTLVVYQTAYGPGEFARHSPGLLLLNHLISEAARRGIAILDLSIGREGYKDDVANIVAEQYTAAMALKVRGIVPAAAWRSASALKRRAKNSPRLVAAIQQVRRALRLAGGKAAGQVQAPPMPTADVAPRLPVGEQA